MIELLRKSLLAAFYVLFIMACAGAQKTVDTTADSKSLAKYELAKKEIRAGKYTQALKLLDEVLKKYPDFNDARIRKATVLHLTKDYTGAVSTYLHVIRSGQPFDPEVYFSLALLYQDMKLYGEAAGMLDSFLLRGVADTKRVMRAEELRRINRFRDNAVKHPVAFNPVKLSSNINTEYSEYTPSLSIDGKKLVFTRRVNGQEDLYISTMDKGEYGPALPISELNTHRNEGAHCLSADGSIIIFTGCDRSDSYGGCDLYYAVYENGGWSKAINMGKRVNTPAYESQPSLSADGRTLFFSSNRTGGYGMKDIWITHLDEDNRWSAPYNAGPMINTEGNDETPFIHADGSTLYFRSDGRLGMGDYDIFHSKWSDASNSWSEAVNLGYPVNTEYSEGGLTVSADGQKAFFASDQAYDRNDVKANLDIYSFDMDASIRPIPATYVKGKVTDYSTGKALAATVQIVNLATGKTQYKTRTTAEGTFITGMALGYDYACYAEKDGYLFYSHHFTLSKSQNPEVFFELEITLVPIPPKKDTLLHTFEPVVLQNIFFESGQAVLLPASYTEIDRLAAMLMNHPELKITITGHTDNVGAAQDNLVLSEKRAKAVADALVEKGILKERIQTEGKGESQPVATNDTPEGRQQNRRTEFRIWR